MEKIYSPQKFLITFLLLNLLVSRQIWSNAVENDCFESPRNWKISPFQKNLKGLTRAKYEHLINQFQKKFSPIIHENSGKKLIIMNLWEESRVNASATLDLDDNPIVKIYGGLARHPLIDEDTLNLFLCHELGHHLGGEPKKLHPHTQLPTWSSAEGQADYFAASDCMQFLLEDSFDPKSFSKNSQLKFQALFKASECKTEICLRIFKAGYKAGKIISDIRKDTAPVIPLGELPPAQETILKHSNSQCRFKTFTTGAQCSDFLLSHSFQTQLDGHKICLQSQVSELLRPKCWFRGE